MGLNVAVGVLLENEDPEGRAETLAELAAVNDVLRAAGLPEHQEPQSGDWEPLGFDMWGYSGLHYLRRVAAHLAIGEELPPPGDEESTEEDPIVERYYEAAVGPSSLRSLFRRKAQLHRRFDHLMQHSDAEGFYVPVSFDEVLFDDRLVGSMLGSSQRLLGELDELADALGVPAGLDPEADELFRAAEQQGAGNGWQAYGVESLTLVQLRAAARASVERGAAIVFA